MILHTVWSVERRTDRKPGARFVSELLHTQLRAEVCAPLVKETNEYIGLSVTSSFVYDR